MLKVFINGKIWTSEEPIKDIDGLRDHRGRKWGVSGCRCEPCLLSHITFISTCKKDKEK